jgi:hypothetical protein
MLKAIRSALTALAVLFLFVLPSNAQQTLGSINGTVTDSSGGVVQGARVKVHHVDTGLEQTATTKSVPAFCFFFGRLV